MLKGNPPKTCNNELNELEKIPINHYIKLPDANMIPKAFPTKSSIPEDSCFAALISPNKESYDGGASAAVLKAKKVKKYEHNYQF